VKAPRMPRRITGKLLLKLLEQLVLVPGCFLLQNLTLRPKRPEVIKNILIINQCCLTNKGDAAILKGAMKVINSAFPNSRSVIVSHTPSEDKLRSAARIVPNYRFLGTNAFQFVIGLTRLSGFIIIYHSFGSNKILRSQLFRKFADETLMEYARASLIIHRGGDNLTETYGNLNIFLGSILIGILLRKPVIILGDSIGPFTTKANKRFAKAVLNNVEVIITRDRNSVDNLHKLSIYKPKIFATADLAFTLEPSSRERLLLMLHSENLEKMKMPMIVVSISALIARYSFSKVPENLKVDQLITAMASIVRYYREKLGASFVFINHVNEEGNDDRTISRQIVNSLDDRRDVFVMQSEHEHEDFKAFLAEYADLFIGARMHANIAAVSVGVPTIALAYSQKTYGVLGTMFGISDFVVDVRQAPDGAFLFEEMISKIDMLWNCRDKVRKELARRMVEVKEKAWTNAEILEAWYGHAL
jgi:colanic acid/amylovoran biosynthesis protein